MDPNEALRQILRGVRIADHVEALRGWLVRHGFQPDIEAPEDTIEAFSKLLRHTDTPAQLQDWEVVRVSANIDNLLVLRARNWVPFLNWNQVLEIANTHTVDGVVVTDDDEDLEDSESDDSDLDTTDDTELDDDFDSTEDESETESDTESDSDDSEAVEDL